MRYYVLLLLLLTTCLLTACGSDAGRAIKDPVMFTRTEITPLAPGSTQAQPKIVLSSPADSLQLYRNIQALPHLPGHPTCEHKPGSRYRVAFITPKPILYATIDKSDCGTITLEKGGKTIYQGDEHFWLYLSRLTQGRIP